MEILETRVTREIRKIRTGFLIAMLAVGPLSLSSQDFPRAEGITPGQGLFGLGFIIGEPTGFSAKYWTSGTRALDFALGPSFYGDFRFHGMYLYHVDAFDYQRAPLHYGIGISIAGKGGRGAFIGEHRADHRNEIGIGPRGSLGVSFMPRSAPFDIFVEIGATLFIIRPVGMDIDASIGARYYF
jgi:hypothetical protein